MSCASEPANNRAKQFGEIEAMCYMQYMKYMYMQCNQLYLNSQLC